MTSGLENVKEPAVRLEDIDEDGCLDVGVDTTSYRDNHTWYVQDRSGTNCLVTFHGVALLDDGPITLEAAATEARAASRN